MGLPKINIQFKELGSTGIRRSGRGVVALILKDDSAVSKEYKRLDQVSELDFKSSNYEYIQDVFRGAPSKVIIEVVAEVDGVVDSAVQKLKNKRFNYLAMPEASKEESTALISFIETSRQQDNKTFKLVAANEPADSELIINFTTDGIETDDRNYTTQEFTARIAGVLAGLSLSRSATYFVLPEVNSIQAIENADTAIDAGELILVDDGEKIKIGRAVNSLVTLSDGVDGDGKGEAYKKIKIVEGLHLVEEDIRNTFEDYYIGRYVNDYDNKVLFVTAVNSYLQELERGYVLDRGFENLVGVDVDAQQKYIESKGVSTIDLSEQEIKEYNTGSQVFINGRMKFVDAMEDLDFNIYI